uniref:Ribonucleoprotein, chloroplastic n=1 Tax=Anthurium amnicola TaxID=1678845 RepID=A0A1D1YQB8_9ARAE
MATAAPAAAAMAAASSSSPPSPVATKLAPSRMPTALASPSSLRFPPLLSPFLPLSVSISTSRCQPPLFTVVLGLRHKRTPAPKLLSVVDLEKAVTENEEEIDGRDPESGEERPPAGARDMVRPIELYVCNLPRTCDISDLLDIFSPYGTVQSVEVSRNPETGVSRGCGYVTLSSILEAKEAVAALDGSELGGREMRVKFSVDTVCGRKIPATLNTEIRKVIYYEGPHKIYVGNLSLFVQPADLREYFSQFGTVVSVKLFHDRKSGKRRVYAFLSLSNVEEVQAAVSSSGREFHGRPLLVRQAIDRK